jgi:ubiquinone/menaquinone biosynthesis C-methylase UbiE
VSDQAKAERFAALQAERAAALVARLEQLVTLHGDERALDVGTGTGALAFALAPRVREVVAVDADAAMVEKARASAPPNVSLVEADATNLPFESGSFDLAATLRTLHHVRRPELVVAELVRVTRPGGILLVVDQIAPVDPLEAFALNRFEIERDPSTTRVLADADLRGLFDANELVLRRSEFDREPRDLDPYLDLAGCEGEARARAQALAPPDYTAVLGWYVLAKRGLSFR